MTELDGADFVSGCCCCCGLSLGIEIFSASGGPRFALSNFNLDFPGAESHIDILVLCRVRLDVLKLVFDGIRHIAKDPVRKGEEKAVDTHVQNAGLIFAKLLLVCSGELSSL